MTSGGSRKRCERAYDSSKFKGLYILRYLKYNKKPMRFNELSNFWSKSWYILSSSYAQLWEIVIFFTSTSNSKIILILGFLEVVEVIQRPLKSCRKLRKFSGTWANSSTGQRVVIDQRSTGQGGRERIHPSEPAQDGWLRKGRLENPPAGRSSRVGRGTRAPSHTWT